jgi:hypothetical protein
MSDKLNATQAAKLKGTKAPANEIKVCLGL